jgi:hypothetical protein
MFAMSGKPMLALGGRGALLETRKQGIENTRRRKPISSKVERVDVVPAASCRQRNFPTPSVARELRSILIEQWKARKSLTSGTAGLAYDKGSDVTGRIFSRKRQWSIVEGDERGQVGPSTA